MGLYRAGATYCTQCEAEGFRRITYFLDRPGRDGGLHHAHRSRQGRSAGPARQRQSRSRTATCRAPSRHFAAWHDPFPKPSYLFALVGGDLGERRGHASPPCRAARSALAIYVEPGKEDRCGYAMDSLKRSMRWDEAGVRPRIRSRHLHDRRRVRLQHGRDGEQGPQRLQRQIRPGLADTATDGDYAGIEAVIAHEYFHNWTGDRITCRDWFQLCLKEGLTVFRDQEFTADQRSRAVERISDVRGLRAHQFVEDAGPLAHPVRPEVYHEINNFYTATVYEKGAEVVRMIQHAARPRRSARAWTSTSRATTARPRPSSNSCSASPMSAAAT